jgi:23S rRNA (pseudouridine1915-N3)-methyltransferase
MRLQLVAVGQRMPTWVQTAFDEYAKRLPNEARLILTELPVAHRGKNADIARLKTAEGEKILKAALPGAELIALDEAGSLHDTRYWSQSLQRWQQQGQDVTMVIGGPDGLAPEVLAAARQRWSLSPLTFPHPLVRVLVAEQWYRAWSASVGHPYHRA